MRPNAWQSHAHGVLRGITGGASHREVLSECLSRMMGNYHVRFLGGKGAVRPLTYPVNHE